MKKPLILLLHIGYWFTYLLLALVMVYVLSGNDNLNESVDEEVIFMALLCMALLPAIATFYIFYLILFPRFFGRKKIGLAFVIGAGVALGTVIIGFAFLGGLVYPECASEAEPSHVLRSIGVIAFFNLMSGGIAFVIKGFSTWFEEVKIKEALLEKNHSMELALVKSQLDPHFLFNTINNIDVLILKDADEASEYLNRLSDIMRFMLYETKTAVIPLHKELTYIEKYIELALLHE